MLKKSIVINFLVQNQFPYFPFLFLVFTHQKKKDIKSCQIAKKKI